MEIKKEKSFPRGGRKPALFRSSNNSAFSFIKRTTKPKKKVKKVKQSERKALKIKPVEKPLQEGFTLRRVEDLKPSILQNGMLVLSIVSKVTEKLIIVSLPGGLRGSISLANVSEFYKSIIEKCSRNFEIPTLEELFQVGDVLPVKVLSAAEEHKCLILTCDPKVVNENLVYNLIECGIILNGSVKSQEEYGYIIDFGIEHVHGFLNYGKVNQNQNLKIGQIVRCSIIQCTISSGSCSVQLSILKKDLLTAFIKKNSTLPLYCFIPGFQFEVTVKKVLFEGVEVSRNEKDSSKGYIHEDHFVKKFSNPADLEIDTKVIATLLYVKPLVNFLYFKIFPKTQPEWPFQFGEIVSGKVAKVRRTGVIFKIIEGAKKAKCFVPLSKLKSGSDLKDKSEILNLYPINKKVSKIRLGHVDFMGRYYLGATDRLSIMEKYFSISDIKCGDIVPCKIVAFGKSVARLLIGRTIKGIVKFSDMSDVPLRNPTSKFKVEQRVKARVLNVMSEKLLCRLTMKPTLLKEKEILYDCKECKKNNYYVGTVCKVTTNKVFVRFFNQIFGMIPKHLTPYLDSKSLNNHFYEGQLIKCIVVGVKGKNRVDLSLLQINSDVQLIIGKKYKVTVINKTEDGLFLSVYVNKSTKCQGYLPCALLTEHCSLISALHSTYVPGEKFSAYCIFNDTTVGAPFFGAEEVFKNFYEGKNVDELQKLLTTDSVLPFLFLNKSSKTNRIILRSLIPGKNRCKVMVVRDDFPKAYPFLKYQLMYGKILNIRNERVEISTKLHDVWDKSFHSSLDFLNSYLNAMTVLVQRQKNKLNSYKGSVYLGCPVKGIIEEVRAKHAIVRTEEGDLGIAEGKFEEGQNIYGKIIWIDGPEQIFYLKTNVGDSLNGQPKKSSQVLKFNNIRGKVIFVSQEAIVLELRGRARGELAFLPRKRHLNDFLGTECLMTVGEELNVWITRKNSNYFLAMDRRIISLQEKIVWKKSERKLKESVQNLKRKLASEKVERLKKRKTESEPEPDEIQMIDVKLTDRPNKENWEESDKLLEVKKEKDVEDAEFTGAVNGMPRLEFDNIDIKSEADVDDTEKLNQIYNAHNDEKIELSSSSESGDEEEKSKIIDNSEAFKVGFNWEVLNNHSLLSEVLLNKDESSSDDEDDESKTEKKKKRRLTALEKKEKAKSEEERLRLIEERLMDTERELETADDFDRAVLADPNSSALWLKYMAFHIQGTEIEKARAVARRALKAISFREEQEKLNIWIAFLNLENMYGNEDSLNKTLSEALQVNEPYKIHLHMLKIHGQSNRLQDMEKLGNFMMKKYKDKESVWCDVASEYYLVGKIESARNVLQKALIIVDKTQHVPLISKFAQLENRYGSPERAQTLFESILASFPKRVDIWSCYVDMLVKSNHIDLARQVLERATSQSLRPRKMKTLFKKFLAFEEAHGTPENVEKVREAAVEYVEIVGFVGN